MAWKFFIDRHYYIEKVYLLDLNEKTEQSRYAHIEDGKIVMIPFDGMKADDQPKPLFNFDMNVRENRALLQAMADGLYEAGYLQKIDEAKRIAASALADERSLDKMYFQNLNKEIMHKLLELKK